MAKRRKRRTDEELLVDLEKELEELRARIKERSGFSPAAIAEERERLELSAKDYGELVGVSHLTIYNWEHGRSRPRAKQLARWLKVKGIGKREAWRRLGY